MDLLDRLLGHDVWTTRQLLTLSEGLSDEELDREFGMAQGTVRATLTHVIRNVEAWTDLMAERAIRESRGTSVSELVERLDSAGADLARVAGQVAERNGWDETWLDPTESPPMARTYGGTIAHVITHSMHHRAHVLIMLDQLGIEGRPEGDVLSWETQMGANK